MYTECPLHSRCHISATYNNSGGRTAFISEGEGYKLFNINFSENVADGKEGPKLVQT